MKNSKNILIIMLLGFLLFSCNGKKVSDSSSSSINETSTTSIESSSSSSEEESSSLEEDKSSDNIIDGDELQSDWEWDK